MFTRILVTQNEELKKLNGKVQKELYNTLVKLAEKENDVFALRQELIGLKNLTTFDHLPDDVLHNLSGFVGKSFAVFGSLNKRCKGVYDAYNVPKETFKSGFAPLQMIRQYYTAPEYKAEAIVNYNRKDILETALELHSVDNSFRLHQQDVTLLSFTSRVAILQERLDILEGILKNSTPNTLIHLRILGLCQFAAYEGKLQALKCLKHNGFKYDHHTWEAANGGGNEQIIQYLQDNGCPTRWDEDEKDSSESESEDSDF